MIGSAHATLDVACVRTWFDLASVAIGDQREHLTLLDAAIGDADHGANMDRGFNAVRRMLAEQGDDTTPRALMGEAASTLMSTVGGASGALWGTALRCAAGAVGDDAEFDLPTVAVALQAALDGIVEIGAASVGDKTMVDALDPAVAALHAAVASGASPDRAMADAVRAGEAGMRATIPLRAAKGRASYLGDRSIGHQDPGATSTVIILRGLREALAG